MKYFYVLNGVIEAGPRDVPASWQNISGFNLLSDAELATYGWLPDVRIGFDLVPTDTQVKEGPVRTIFADRVESVWTIRDKTQEELDQEAAEDLAEFEEMVTEVVEGQVGKALFKIVNEIRSLQGLPNVSASQFRTWFRNQQT